MGVVIGRGSRMVCDYAWWEGEFFATAHVDGSAVHTAFTPTHHRAARAVAQATKLRINWRAQ
jgi:hypothetical protein